MPTFDTPDPITATIEIQTGYLLIRASDRTDTVVEVRPRDDSVPGDVEAAEQTHVEYSNGQLTVAGPKNRFRSIFGRTPSVEVTVDLPSGSRVDAKSASDIRTEGLLGDSTFNSAAGSLHLDRTGRLRARTAAGDITVGDVTGDADVATSAGRIRLGEVEGSAVAKSSSGDVTVGGVTGDLRLNTAYGDIAVGLALTGLTAKTAYGAVRVDELVRGEAVLETGFGAMEIGIREGTAAWLDIDSGQGVIRSELDATTGPEDAEDTVKVRARTAFGDIVVRRPLAAGPNAD